MEPSIPKPLISISLDIAGSTRAKSEIVERNHGDAAVVRAEYEHLFRQFYQIESEFYEALLGSHRSRTADRLLRSEVFLVKTIGDEAWIVVEVEPDATDLEFTKRANIVLQAGLVAVTRSIQSSGSSLKLKMYVDLLEETIEANELRLQDFQGLCKAEVAADTATSPAQVTQEIYDRLVGAVTVQAGYPKAGVTSRTDFVGLPVDRFFRCTKFVEEGSIAIGEAYARRLVLHESTLPTTEDERKEVALTIPTGPDSTKFERLLLTRETATKRQLKGLSKSYVLFHVAHPALAGLSGTGPPETP